MPSRWGLARLQFLGNVLAMPEGHPMLVVARCLLADYRMAHRGGADGMPQDAKWPTVWNLITVTLDLRRLIAGLQAMDDGRRSP